MKVQFYSASRHAQDASETAASVTVITRLDIRAYGYRTLASIQSGRPPAAARAAFPRSGKLRAQADSGAPRSEL